MYVMVVMNGKSYEECRGGNGRNDKSCIGYAHL